MPVADEIRDSALAFSLDERAELARDLLLSLEAEELDNDVEQAWTDEAMRRSQAFAQGETTARDWRESVRRVRQSLAARRNL
jgi:hypothetical protein